MNGKMFVEMMKEKVFPAALAAVGSWADKIVMQIDSAGGHGIKTSLPELEKEREQTWKDEETGVERKVVVEVVTQPTRSPDLNVLDLGAWNSLQTAVESEKLVGDGKAENQKSFHYIIDLVKRTWEKWESEEKLKALFDTLEENMKKIVECGGDNRYDMHKNRK